MEDLKPLFKQLVEEVKEKYNLTQEQIADQMSISRPYLSELINTGRTVVKKKHIEKIKNTTFKSVENVVSHETEKVQPMDKWADSFNKLSESILIDARNRDRLITMLENKANSSDAANLEIHSAKLFAIEEYILTLGQKINGTDRKAESVTLGTLEGVGFRLGEGTYKPPNESEDKKSKSGHTETAQG